MELTKIVTSLEASKKLKELGVKQESIFSWIQTYDSTLAPILNHSIARTPDVRGDLYLVDKSPNGRNYSAFTASELAELLPNDLETKEVHHHLVIISCKNNEDYEVDYRNIYNQSMIPPTIKGRTLVEALAACLIYLKENKLI